MSSTEGTLRMVSICVAPPACCFVGLSFLIHKSNRHGISFYHSTERPEKSPEKFHDEGTLRPACLDMK